MAKRKGFRNNLVLWVLLSILLICFVLLGVGFWKYFYSGSSNSKYGDRLEGIDKYPLSETLGDDIKSLYKDDTNIDGVNVTVEGRIIYITINFVKSIKVTTAQDTAVKSLDKIGSENLTYYDVQYILTYSGSDENSNFPIFGSKSSSSLKVVW